MWPEIELNSAPATRGVYRRAALGLLRRRRRPKALPEVVYTRRTVLADRSQVAAYAKVCGFDLTDPLPPTFPHILAFPMALMLMSDDVFPVPVVGLVHVSNELQARAAIPADAPLAVRVFAENLRSHPRGRQFDIVACASTGGAEVWRGRSTYLRIESKTPMRGRPDTQPKGTERAHDGEFWPVRASIGREYAAASGDRNPIHTSRLAARLFGYQRPIAHGMWSFARCLAAIPRLDPPFTATVAFRAPILLPGAVAWHQDSASFELTDPATGRVHVIGTVHA